MISAPYWYKKTESHLAMAEQSQESMQILVPGQRDCSDRHTVRVRASAARVAVGRARRAAQVVVAAHKGRAQAPLRGRIGRLQLALAAVDRHLLASDGRGLDKL